MFKRIRFFIGISYRRASDKVCDQISDTVLDTVLREDPKGRVACEHFIWAVIVGGEITTSTYVDVADLVREL